MIASVDGAFAQTLIAGAVVLGAVAFLCRRAWRTTAAARRATEQDASCAAGSCGCGDASAPAEPRAAPLHK